MNQYLSKTTQNTPSISSMDEVPCHGEFNERKRYSIDKSSDNNDNRGELSKSEKRTFSSVESD